MAAKKERDREAAALEDVVERLRRLDVQRYSSQRGTYMGGRKAVRRVLEYLDLRFPA